MDYLPLHRLSDDYLAQLRTRPALETWLPRLHQLTDEELTAQLALKFPSLPPVRLRLLAHRLRELAPLLQQQLQLYQLYEALPSEAIEQLAELNAKTAAIAVLSTIAQISQITSDTAQMQAAQIPQSFDLILVDDAHLLDWPALEQLARLGKKLVLAGSPPLASQPICAEGNHIQEKFPRPFDGLLQQLLPAYCCHLKQQFRLHPELAAPIHQALGEAWTRSGFQPQLHSSLPPLSNCFSRIVWQDVPGVAVAEGDSYRNELEGQRLLEFWQEQLESHQVGIFAAQSAQRDWLQRHCPASCSDSLIGTVADWVGQERSVVLLSLVGQKISPEVIRLALTRAQNYLIIFGDAAVWRNQPLIASLLAHSAVQLERLAVLK